MYSFPNINPSAPSPLASISIGGSPAGHHHHQMHPMSLSASGASASSSIPSLSSLGGSSALLAQQMAGRGTSSIKHTSSALIKQYRSLTKQLFDGLVLQLSSNLPSSISNANSPTIVDVMNRIVEVDANLQKCIKEREYNVPERQTTTPMSWMNAEDDENVDERAYLMRC